MERRKKGWKGEEEEMKEGRQKERRKERRKKFSVKGRKEGTREGNDNGQRTIVVEVKLAARDKKVSTVHGDGQRRE